MKWQKPELINVRYIVHEYGQFQNYREVLDYNDQPRFVYFLFLISRITGNTILFLYNYWLNRFEKDEYIPYSWEKDDSGSPYEFDVSILWKVLDYLSGFNIVRFGLNYKKTKEGF